MILAIVIFVGKLILVFIKNSIVSIQSISHVLFYAIIYLSIKLIILHLVLSNNFPYHILGFSLMGFTNVSSFHF